jgi:hypothetical protein
MTRPNVNAPIYGRNAAITRTLFAEGGRSGPARRCMSEQAEWCKKKAAECGRRAALANEEHLKRVYVEPAQQWLEMVQQAEFFDRDRRKS